jgi:hypothetical protein
VSSARPTGANREQRVRVSVRKSVRDANLFVVRPLAAGQSPPPGAREAFIVLAGDDLLDSLAPTASHVG